jgi:hypothetical protein
MPTTSSPARTLAEIKGEIRALDAKTRARRLRDAPAAAAALAWVKALPQGDRRRLLLAPTGRFRGESRAHHVLRRVRLEAWFNRMLADAIAAALPPRPAPLLTAPCPSPANGRYDPSRLFPHEK